MADTMRWRCGDTNLVIAAVDVRGAIEIGDLVYVDRTGEREVVKSGALAPDAETFRNSFMGVAMDRSRIGDALDIRVATSGVFEYACPEAVYELGQELAITPTESQQVARTNIDSEVIAKVQQRTLDNTSSATVLVDIRSVVMA